jgi:hypothetical protein
MVWQTPPFKMFCLYKARIRQSSHQREILPVFLVW